MSSNNQGHYFRPLKSAVLARSQPDISGVEDARQREGDRLFVAALARAFQRGDHLPDAKPEPLKTRPVPATRYPLFFVWEDGHDSDS